MPWVTALGGIILGQALIGAFRGLAPTPVFSPGVGIPALIAWALAPGLFAWLALLVCVERARGAVQAVAAIQHRWMPLQAPLARWTPSQGH